MEEDFEEEDEMDEKCGTDFYIRPVNSANNSLMNGKNTNHYFSN
jgi:hypothetical protein